MPLHTLVRRDDDGAVAIFYAIVFVLVLAPVLAVGTTTLIRSTTTGELQRAADAGSLAGAAAIPFGDVDFAREFLDATAGGPTDRTLRDLGLAYDTEDPLQIACQEVAMANAGDVHTVGHSFATGTTCHAGYLSDADTLTALRDCADGLSAPVAGLPAVPDLSPLLPALLYPGVQVTMSWRVRAPFATVLRSAGSTETVTSIAHRRFKNIVVIPEVGVTPGTTINLNPLAGNVRATALQALDQSRQLLAADPVTAPCATVLDGAHDDIIDAIDPPGGGPDARQVIDDAIASDSPLVVARVVTAAGGLGIPYLDFVPVCAQRLGTSYVGHLGSFGSCSVSAPGGFRASLRRT